MKKYIKIICCIWAGLTIISIPFILNLTMTNEESHHSPDDINLNNYSLQYLVKVVNMVEITNAEAEVIKTELQTKITNEMTSLNLIEKVDYEIQHLNDIKQGSNLNDFFDKIAISSIETSERAWGSFKVELSIQENIFNRTIQTIMIDAQEANGLTEDTANSIKNYIKISVQTVVSQGQINRLDTDYQINNLELIKETAKFEDYKDKIKVSGISLRLTGEFPITFEINRII